MLNPVAVSVDVIVRGSVGDECVADSTRVNPEPTSVTPSNVKFAVSPGLTRMLNVYVPAGASGLNGTIGSICAPVTDSVSIVTNVVFVAVTVNPVNVSVKVTLSGSR